MNRFETASVQVDFPELEKTLRAFVKNTIDPQDLLPSEIGTPHVTLLAGLLTENPSDIKTAVGSFTRPLIFTFGETGVFPQETCDVLHIKVLSSDSLKVRQLLKILPRKVIEFEDKYQPHLTVSYLVPGRGHKYVGLKPLSGIHIKKELVLSKTSGDKESLLIH